MIKKMVRGFTLIELVMVIVVLGILAAGSVKFIAFSAQGLVDTTERQALASSATIAVEKVMREVRRALPNSVRRFPDGGAECIEMVPILYSSEYISIPTASAAISFDSIKFVNGDGTEAGYAAVYPDSLGSVYDGNQSISTMTATASAVGIPSADLQRITFSAAPGIVFRQARQESVFI